MALPPTLEKLTFGLKFNQSLEGGELGNWDWDAATLQHAFFFLALLNQQLWTYTICMDVHCKILPSVYNFIDAHYPGLVPKLG